MATVKCSSGDSTFSVRVGGRKETHPCDDGHNFQACERDDVNENFRYVIAEMVLESSIFFYGIPLFS